MVTQVKCLNGFKICKRNEDHQYYMFSTGKHSIAEIAIKIENELDYDDEKLLEVRIIYDRLHSTDLSE